MYKKAIRTIGAVIFLVMTFWGIGVQQSEAADPGGVSGLTHWLRADAGVYSDALCSVAATNGQDIACWADQATGGSNNAAPAVNGPSLSVGAVNGFDAITFEEASSESLTIPSNPLPTAAATDPYTTFLVFSPNDSSAFLLRGNDSGANRMLVRINASSMDVQVSGEALLSYSTNFSGTSAVPQVVAAKKIDNTTNNTIWYYNGQSFGTRTDDSQHGTQSVDISPSVGYYNGQVLESLTYGVALSDADRAKVETYLALKYGFTLDQTTGKDYVLSSDVEVWDKDAAGASTYKYDIAGIVRDDTNSDLNIAEAKSQNADAVVTITGSGLALGEALVWGNNNGGASWTSTGAPTDYELLSRQWSVQETGDTGALTIAVDTSDTSFDIPAAGTDGIYYFIYDSDDDGSFADETPTAMTDQGSGVWSVGSINLADGVEFTIAKDVSIDPLIAYSGQFDENNPGDGEGDGTLTGSIVATIDTGQTAETFALSSGSTLTAGTHYITRNVPSGYTAVATVGSGATSVTFTLTGTPSGGHTTSDDVSNLMWVFTDAAFTGGSYIGLEDYVCKIDGSINFIGDGSGVSASIGYSSSTFSEAGANDGSISNTLIITLSGDTFASDVVSAAYVTSSNVPAGLAASFVRDSGTQITMSLLGNATSHENSNDISNLSVTFLDGAFTANGTASDVTNYSKADILVDFENAAAAGSSNGGGSSTVSASSPIAAVPAGGSSSQSATTLAGIQVIAATIDSVENLSSVAKVLLKQLLISLFVAKITNQPPSLEAIATDSLSDNVASFPDPSPLSAVTPNQCIPITLTTLQVGDTGSEVTRLQGYLAAGGYYSGSISGEFDESVEEAVREFQAEAGLATDGLAGLQTLQRLEVAVCGKQVTNFAQFYTRAQANSGVGVCPLLSPVTLELGASGKAVMNLQTNLVTLGLLESGAISEVYDEQTELAVKTFQAEQALRVDGKVGPITRQAINQICSQ